MIKYAHILLEAANTPWAMEPNKLAAMVAIFRHAVRGAKLSDAEIAANIADASTTVDAARMHPNTDKSIANRPGNIGLISLRGVLSNRAPMVDNVSTGGGTNMERFGAAFRAALASDDIKALIIDVDSPGGSVFGTSEMADEIMRARGNGKPVIAQVNALCASAAYWIASACDEIVVTPSGQVGSIGVYTVHEDVSKMYEEAGIRETLISAGKYKVEGNPFEPLGDDARAAMQAMVDGYYDMFVGGVAQGRGVTVSAVRDGFGQGRCLDAATAVSLNMADRTGTLSDTLSRWGVKMGNAGSSKTGASAEAAPAEPAAAAPEPPASAEPAAAEEPIATPARNRAQRYLELNS